MGPFSPRNGVQGLSKPEIIIGSVTPSLSWASKTEEVTIAENRMLVTLLKTQTNNNGFIHGKKRGGFESANPMKPLPVLTFRRSNGMFKEATDPVISARCVPLAVGEAASLPGGLFRDPWPTGDDRWRETESGPSFPSPP